jgi:hypothetical protein
MDGRRFDEVTRSLAAGGSRRVILRSALGVAASLFGVQRASAAPTRPCTGSHFDCPGKQLCTFDDASEQLFCKEVEGVDHSEWRVCKGEFEFTYCQRSSICCVYPEIRDPGGLSLVANCCDNGLICDTERGCVPPRPSS